MGGDSHLFDWRSRRIFAANIRRERSERSFDVGPWAGFFTIPTEALGGALLACEAEYMADKRKLLLKEVTDPPFLSLVTHFLSGNYTEFLDLKRPCVC